MLAQSIEHPVVELVFAVVTLALVISLHGWALLAISRRFSEHVARASVTTPAITAFGLMWTTVCLLVCLHLAELFVWALPMLGLGLMGTLRDTYFFSVSVYTTLGTDRLTLPDGWRLLGPFIAVSGLFTFGWTGSVLVFMTSEIGRLQVEKARHRAAKHSRQTG